MAQTQKPAPKVKTTTLELKIVGEPHNGTPEYRVPDRVTGGMIGGQVQIIRAALRYKRVVCPVGRRAGKTTLRPFLWATEQAMTAGTYYAAIATSGHVKAFEMFKYVRDQLGDLVLESKGEPESQDRWIKTKSLNENGPDAFPRCLLEDPVVGPVIAKNRGKNVGGQLWFFSGAHPHYLSIQGFTHPFHRFDLDECHQLHSGILRVVNPMLLDSGGSMLATGIPDIDSQGNDWFSDYFDKGLDPEKQHRWHSISFPSYANPHLNQEALAEISDDVLTSDDFTQQILAQFISGSGAVFRNLEKVFVLKPKWKREHPSQLDLPAWALALLTRAPSDMLSMWVYEDAPRAGHHLALTVDFAGRTRTRDATIIDVFDLTENAQVCAIQIRDMQPPDQLHWIEGVKLVYGAEELHGDNTPEGAALMAYLRERHGVGIRGHNFGASNKGAYVKRGQFLFEMAEVRLIDCAVQKEEFRKFRRITSESRDGKDGPVTYSHPPGKHDDFVAAFLQIAPSMAHGRRVETTPEPEAQPMFEADHKTTTLERFAEGADLPWSRDGDDTEPAGWESVVLPQR